MRGLCTKLPNGSRDCPGGGGLCGCGYQFGPGSRRQFLLLRHRAQGQLSRWVKLFFKAWQGYLLLTLMLHKKHGRGSLNGMMPFFVDFSVITVECTMNDIQETRLNTHVFLPFGKADDTASASLSRVRGSLLQVEALRSTLQRSLHCKEL